jgi:hypothetical protein
VGHLHPLLILLAGDHGEQVGVISFKQIVDLAVLVMNLVRALSTSLFSLAAFSITLS